jgi:hypothetical protein
MKRKKIFTTMRPIAPTTSWLVNGETTTQLIKAQSTKCRKWVASGRAYYKANTPLVLSRVQASPFSRHGKFLARDQQVLKSSNGATARPGPVWLVHVLERNSKERRRMD